jgi:hypothetical protein
LPGAAADSIFVLQTSDPNFQQGYTLPAQAVVAPGTEFSGSIWMVNDPDILQFPASYTMQMTGVWPDPGDNMEGNAFIAVSSSSDGRQWTTPKPVSFSGCTVQHLARPFTLYRPEIDTIFLGADGQVNGQNGMFCFLARGSDWGKNGQYQLYFRGQVNPPNDLWVEGSWIFCPDQAYYLLYRSQDEDAADGLSVWTVRCARCVTASPISMSPGPIVVRPYAGWCSAVVHNPCWVLNPSGWPLGFMFGGAGSGGASIGLAFMRGG